MMDRAEQGKPELLGVLLIALHLDDGEPTGLARTVCPGAQQRRLPAASGSRDDRHLPRRRAIQSGEKITPVDQPGLCSIHRQSPAFVPAPDALPSATLSSRYQATGRSVKRARFGSGPDRHAKASAARSIDPSFVAWPRESPGSGDDLSPAWWQAWVRGEGSHGRAGRAPDSKEMS